MKWRLNTIEVTDDYVCTDNNQVVVVSAMLKNINITLPTPVKGKQIIIALKVGLLKSVTVLSPSGTVHKPTLTVAGTYMYISDGTDWI